MMTALRAFPRLEAAGGILLVAAAALAMLMANSPAAGLYDAFLSTRVELRVGAFALAKPLLLWINDGFMAIFFLLVGLEIKREVLEGELSKPSQMVLPALAAVGGMVAPALIYIALNWTAPMNLRGWAIPTATDIAFALGVLALLGNRVPSSLKMFLLTLAILDDLGAIMIIAVVYTADLSGAALAIAAVCVLALAELNRRHVTSISPYVFIGVVLWIAVLKSGVHATMAGVVLAFFIPLRSREAAAGSPLKRLEEDLQPSVAYAILPLFAFANAGVSLAGLSFRDLVDDVPLGIAAGLFLGKQLGVFGVSWLAVRLGIAVLPAGSRWVTLYGVAVLCGIGFTMSLFIASLAFETNEAYSGVGDRLGILTGSLLSALVGYAVLALTLPRRGGENDEAGAEGAGTKP